MVVVSAMELKIGDRFKLTGTETEPFNCYPLPADQRGVFKVVNQCEEEHDGVVNHLMLEYEEGEKKGQTVEAKLFAWVRVAKL